IVTCSDVATAMKLYKELDGFQVEGAADVCSSPFSLPLLVYSLCFLLGKKMSNPSQLLLSLFSHLLSPPHLSPLTFHLSLPLSSRSSPFISHLSLISSLLLTS